MATGKYRRLTIFSGVSLISLAVEAIMVNGSFFPIFFDGTHQKTGAIISTGGFFYGH
jgi:hypothetical protein